MDETTYGFLTGASAFVIAILGSHAGDHNDIVGKRIGKTS